MTTRPGRRGICFTLAQVTLELSAPLTIGTGHGDDLADALCVSDANGLPTIPATSLAGVLRSAWEEAGLEPATNVIFGHQDGSTGASSLVEVSWAPVHGRDDRPVPPRAEVGSLDGDPVLAFLRAGVQRDHVHIDARGVAAKAGKFDEILVPAGARFSFEILVHGREGVDSEGALRKLLGLLHHGDLRLGGRTRRGYGAFDVVACAGRCFDLSKAEDRDAFRAVTRDLSAPGSGLDSKSWHPERLPAPPTQGRRSVLDVSLKAEDFWLFGTGRPVRPEHRGDNDKPHDKVPVTERRVRWVAGRGEVVATEEAEVLVPAAGIKGALRHRALFHARRRAAVWALSDAGCSEESLRAHEDEARRIADIQSYSSPAVLPTTLPDAPEDQATQAIDDLFGTSKARAEGGEDGLGHPGRLFITDLFLDPMKARSQPVQHVSLDRFTQGPMEGLLFSEAPVAVGPELRFRVVVDGRGVSPMARQALADALRDLAGGRLALGAGASRGHGYFRGRIEGLEKLEETQGGDA